MDNPEITPLLNEVENAPKSFLATPIAEPLARSHRLLALATCIGAALLTAVLMPIAGSKGPDLPGFVLINQTSLLIAYSLSAWVLLQQCRHARSLPICLLGAGTLYTAAIILLQLMSFPGALARARVLGNGPETTTWLWTFWHLGPPAFAIAFGLARQRDAGRLLSSSRIAVSLAIAGALVLTVFAAVISTVALPWLPLQVVGDDYTAMTASGVGPAVQLLTVAALVVVWWRSRTRRSVLELWLCVSLVLLICDNFLTMAGGARASVGWYVGRVEAFASAFVILGAYLAEMDALRRRAEAAAANVQRAEAALRQAQKMEAVGRLTGGIAHDFNNLLMIVSSGFDSIRRRPDDRARVLKTAEAGLQAVDRGSKLTRQLLTFARRQNLRPETVNPNALLIEFERLGQRAVGEAIKLTFDLHPALHPVELDPSEFEAALLNLIVNARDAVSPQHGSITVRTRNVSAEAAGRSTPNALTRGDYVVVSVIDNGSGMTEEIRAQVFEPFFTTKEFGRGSGLGLSQVYGFVQASGGAVEIKSSPGAGTTVEMWLPKAASAQAALARTHNAASPLRRAEAGETVLAVEDEPEVLASAVEALSDLGYRVLSARDAAEALERLRGDERIDILFSDIVMPGGMNGVQLAVEAGRIRPGMRVLLTSGYTGEALVGEHRVPPDVAILPKPYRQHELAERLKIAVMSGS